MFIKNSDDPKLTSLFSPDNIRIFNNKENVGTLLFKLLENLALHYGIANVIRIYNTKYKKNSSSLKPLIISDEVVAYHFQLPTIDNLQIATAILKNGLDANNSKYPLDITKILMVIISPKKRPDLFLKVEKSLKQLLGNENIRKTILNLNDPKGIWSFIDQAKESRLDNIFAGDIMIKVNEVINESNTLKDAIDLIVQYKMLHIPVIDNDEELLGEVNANEIMKICLPQHILWMSNINSIINFEPYYDMLHHEEITWMAEIMTQEIATIQVDDYAMKAAINMTIMETDRVYVLDDKKLVGIIKLDHFLKKVLRP